MSRNEYDLRLVSSTRLICHLEPSGGASGQATDIALHAKEILRIRAQLTDIYVSHCKTPEEDVEKAKERFERSLERDYYMTAEEAIKFGIVDKVVDRRGDAVAEENK